MPIVIASFAMSPALNFSSKDALTVTLLSGMVRVYVVPSVTVVSATSAPFPSAAESVLSLYLSSAETVRVTVSPFEMSLVLLAVIEPCSIEPMDMV